METQIKDRFKNSFCTYSTEYIMYIIIIINCGWPRKKNSIYFYNILVLCIGSKIPNPNPIGFRIGFFSFGFGFRVDDVVIIRKIRYPVGGIVGYVRLNDPYWEVKIAILPVCVGSRYQTIVITMVTVNTPRDYWNLSLWWNGYSASLFYLSILGICHRLTAGWHSHNPLSCDVINTWVILGPGQWQSVGGGHGG